MARGRSGVVLSTSILPDGRLRPTPMNLIPTRLELVATKGAIQLSLRAIIDQSITDTKVSNKDFGKACPLLDQGSGYGIETLTRRKFPVAAHKWLRKHYHSGAIIRLVIASVKSMAVQNDWRSG